LKINLLSLFLVSKIKFLFIYFFWIFW